MNEISCSVLHCLSHRSTHDDHVLAECPGHDVLQAGKRDLDRSARRRREVTYPVGGHPDSLSDKDRRDGDDDEVHEARIEEGRDDGSAPLDHKRAPARFQRRQMIQHLL